MLPGLSASVAGAANYPQHYIGSASSTASLTTYTFSSFNIGGPGLIVVAIVGSYTGGPAGFGTISSATIGGSAATLAVKITGDVNAPIGIFYRRVTSGTTATITVTFSKAFAGCAIMVYRLTDTASDTPHNSAEGGGSGRTSTSVSLNVPANGVTLAVSSVNDSLSTAWTNLTKDVDALNGAVGYSSASLDKMSQQTGRSISIATISSTTQRLVAASWG